MTVTTGQGRSYVQQGYKIWYGTWNLGNEPPPHDFSQWLNGYHNDYDIIAIGTQECLYDCSKDLFTGNPTL